MKSLLLVLAVVLVGCGEKPLIAGPIVEKAIRKELNKPTGELTKADLEKVTHLVLNKKQLIEAPSGLEPEPKYARGYGQLFINHVTQAHEGCDFDFLKRGPKSLSRQFTNMKNTLLVIFAL